MVNLTAAIRLGTTGAHSTTSDPACAAAGVEFELGRDRLRGETMGNAGGWPSLETVWPPGPQKCVF